MPDPKAPLETQLLLQVLAEVGTVQSSLGAISAQNVLILDEQKASEQSRQSLHDKVSETSQQVALMNQTLTRIEPIVDRLDGVHKQGSGIAWFLRGIFVLTSGLIASAFVWVAHKLGLLQ